MSVTNDEVSSISGGGGGSNSTTNTTAAAGTTTTTVPSTNNPGSGGSSSLSSSTNTISSPTGGNGHSQSSSTDFRSSTNNMEDDVVKSGYLRKFKGKKKFFVLRKETEAGGPARLEYYATDRKFRMGQPPKKSISLKACFNINQTDSKLKFAIALHTHNDCVRITMNSEEEMNEWLRLMNSMCEDEEEIEESLSPSMVPAKPYFEHVWLVTALNKGLGSQEGILGSYRLCLTSKELTLLKVGDHTGRNAKLKFPLNVIRNVAHDKAYGCFFHIEFGRLACTGAGRLSLKTEDNNIAENIHLLLRKAWQNNAKDEFTPRTRAWTYNDSSRSFHSTPPGMPRIPSMDGSLMSRIRTESISSSSAERRVSGMSPPSSSSIPIQSSPKSNSYSNTLCSTTDSASSSYSMDYENNNNHSNSGSGGGGGSSHAYSKSQDEDDSYVQWNPSDEHSLTLPLHPDNSDYVETSIGAVNGTPSSTADLQSPLSPYDNYIPMSPAGAMAGGNGSARSGGKMSVSHSRNSSLIDDGGYIPMLPGGNHSHSRSESGACSMAGSTTGLDEAYLEMDFPRKLDLSNDDVRRMSPASSESIQSGTPSSDCQLEKVSSYFQSDDFDDGSIAMRPARAYSVGSRSDTSATGKSRFGKNRLEAVQETFRTRAMSVGSKQPQRKMINPSTIASAGMTSSTGGSILSGIGPSRSGSAAPLSSSWSGSTGRWLPPKFHYPPAGQNAPLIAAPYPSINHQAQDSGDSDLMELDFSHNKQKSRKRSLPGPGGNLSSSSSTGSGGTKLSPCARVVLGSETPPILDTPDTPKSSFSANFCGSGNASPRYPTSAPILIQKNNKGFDCSGFVDSGNSILTRMTGYDLKKLKELDDDGAYLSMDLSAPPPINGGHSAIQTTKSACTTKPSNGKPGKVDTPQVSSTKLSGDKGGLYSSVVKSVPEPTVNGINPVIVKANENTAAAKFTFSNSTGSNCNEPPCLSRSLSSSSNISTISNNSNSSSTSCISVKSQQQAPLSPERSVSLTLNVPGSPPVSANPGSSTSSGPSSTVPGGSVTPTGSSSTLTRIEESPEKAHSQHAYFPMQPSQFTSSPLALKKGCQEDGQVTYTPVYHFPPTTPLRRNSSYPSDMAGKISSGVPQPSSCSKQNQNSLLTTSTSKFSPLTSGPVNYAQVEFLKSSDDVKRN